jgi:hypothetical protein
MDIFEKIVGGYVLFVLLCTAVIFVKEIIKGMNSEERNE